MGRPDEKTRSGLCAFPKTKESVITTTRICVWDEADQEEDMMSHTYAHSLMTSYLSKSQTAALHHTCLYMVTAGTGLVLTHYRQRWAEWKNYKQKKKLMERQAKHEKKGE